MSFPSSKDEASSSSQTNKLTVVSGAAGTKPDVFLGQGCKITGTLTFTGNVEIEGEVEGEIRSEGRLSIGETGKVNAKIQGVEVIVKGKIVGDISATKRLVIQRPSHITGNISCSNLVVEEGAILEGKISMHTASSNSLSN